MHMSAPLPQGVAVSGAITPAFAEILSPEALGFVAKLHRKFESRRQELLVARAARQREFDQGKLPDFLPQTKSIREGDWVVAAQPKDMLDRRVEITGPTDRKMVINALNCGASTFMADFEDANCPTWHNMIDGQINLRDAVRRTISLEQNNKKYRLNDQTAVLIPRPRGWHLDEKHVTVDGKPVSGGIFDFALLFFHNAKELLARGSGPYFYLPKMESHLEARLWNDIFVFSQTELGIAQGSIKATALIETVVAAFEMDEILYELREHSAGLNCGRWDYIFSFIKTLRTDPGAVLPDRSQVTMEQPFMRAYTQLVVRTCHRRGVHAMGGMAAQIPIRNDAEASAAALAKVRADKLREVNDGHDGTWVAHPGLVEVARGVFESGMSGPHQLDRRRDDVVVNAADLVRVPQGTRTEAGLRLNIRVGVQYLEAWLRGLGCVPLYNLMEDAATAEISRTQIWHWIHHRAALDDGRTVTRELVEAMLAEEMERVKREIGPERIAAGRFPEAIRLFLEVSTSPHLAEFLTLAALGELHSQHDLSLAPSQESGGHP